MNINEIAEKNKDLCIGDGVLLAAIAWDNMDKYMLSGLCDRCGDYLEDFKLENDLEKHDLTYAEIAELIILIETKLES